MNCSNDQNPSQLLTHAVDEEEPGRTCKVFKQDLKSPSAVSTNKVKCLFSAFICSTSQIVLNLFVSIVFVGGWNLTIFARGRRGRRTGAYLYPNQLDDSVRDEERGEREEETYKSLQIQMIGLSRGRSFFPFVPFFRFVGFRFELPSITNLTKVLTKLCFPSLVLISSSPSPLNRREDLTVSPPLAAPSISSTMTQVGLAPPSPPFFSFSFHPKLNAVLSRAFRIRSSTTREVRSSEALISSTWYPA